MQNRLFRRVGVMDVSVLERLSLILLFIMLGVALYTDMRFGKIYNKLVFPSMVLGIVLAAGRLGMMGVFQSLEGIGLVAALYLILAPAGAFGGGDAKLFMAIGSLMGVGFVCWALAYSALIGGVMAVLIAARHRILISTARNAVMSFFHAGLLSGISGGSRFRYTPAIALGALLTCLLNL
jgi:prepilin peptidase CpaA